MFVCISVRNADKSNCSSQKNVYWFVSIFRDTRIRILCIRLEMLSVRTLYRLHECLNGLETKHIIDPLSVFL